MKQRALFDLLAIAACLALAAACDQASDSTSASPDDQAGPGMIVTIESPADGSGAVIGERVPMRIRAECDCYVETIQWHAVGLLNIFPMQLQYGEHKYSPPLREAILEDELTVPFNHNFKYIDIYALALDVQGNKAVAVSRFEVKDIAQ